MVASSCSAFMAGKVHLVFAFTVHVYKGCKDDIAVHSAVAQVAACHAASHPGQSLAARGSTCVRGTWPGGQVLTLFIKQKLGLNWAVTRALLPPHGFPRQAVAPEGSWP